jgi:hypothetical protein
LSTASITRDSVFGPDPAGVPHVLAWLDRQAADGAWAFGSLDDLRLVTLNPTSADVQRILDQVTTRSAVHGPRGRWPSSPRTQCSLAWPACMPALVDLAVGDVEVFSALVEAEHWLDERQAPST